MSFLGINFDLWHGILAFLGFTIGIQLVFILGAEFNQMTMITWLGIGIVLVIFLQWLNEKIQRNEPAKTIIKKYGSIKNFEKNSKRDWKYTIIGLLLAIFFNALALSMVYN